MQTSARPPKTCCTRQSIVPWRRSIPPLMSLPAGQRNDLAAAAISSPCPAGSSSWAQTMPRHFPRTAKVPCVKFRFTPSRLMWCPLPTRCFRSSSQTPPTKLKPRGMGGLLCLTPYSCSVLAEVVEDTVAETLWWCKVRGAAWNAPEDQRSSIQQRLNHPVVHVA